MKPARGILLTVQSKNRRKKVVLLLDAQGMVIQSVAVMGEQAPLPFFRSLRRAHRAIGRIRMAVIACWDRKATYKKNISSDYKRRKKFADPDWVELIFRETKLVRELLYYAGAIQVWADGHEADDVIYTMVRRFREKVDSIYIYTRDKDLYQLVGSNVYLIVPPEAVVDSNFVKSQTGVSPKQWLDYKTLVGCPGDAVKGVRGIGPKKAVKLLVEHGNLDGILASGFNPYPGWTKDMKLARKLVRLYNVSSALGGSGLPKPDWKKFAEAAADGGVPNLGGGARFNEIREIFQPS